MSKTILLLCVVISGCATATKLNTGDGVIYRVECDGSAIPLSVCYKRANKLCPAGWDQIDKDGAVLPQGVATPDYAQIGVMQQKSITVRCR
jgi:hypothetical protein